MHRSLKGTVYVNNSLLMITAILLNVYYSDNMIITKSEYESSRAAKYRPSFAGNNINYCTCMLF